MADPAEVLRRFQQALDPYIKPQEEVAYIRRIIALYLESSSEDGLIRRPLSLADGGSEGIEFSISRGAHREYLEALRLNVEARRKFRDACALPTPKSHGTTSSAHHARHYLEERLALLNLQKKRERLHIIRDYLDEHEESPVAAPDYLDLTRVLASVDPLPDVPQEIVDSLIAAQSSSESDLQSHSETLNKIVLRARLDLKHEERLLQQAQKEAESLPEVSSTGAKIRALGAVRNELIEWIETELGKASSGSKPPDEMSNEGGKTQDRMDQGTLEEELSRIRRMYDGYLTHRQTLIGTLVREPESKGAPVLKPQHVEVQACQSIPKPTAHLITPYIERLLALSRKQKAAFAQKSHISTVLSNHTKDASQNLGHLAEESQLLPAHPMKDSLRRRSGLQDELTGKGSGRPDMSRRVKPWVFAADSAKIASLESVAESVERGQISLEATMKTLAEINDLVGETKLQEEETRDAADDTQDDVWMEAEQPTGAARRHTAKSATAKSATAKAVPGDPWSLLHGSLGLLGQEDIPS